MRYVIGIDLGTSGVKSVLFSEKGEAIASATAEYPLYQPQNGWAEQNPEDWWAGTTQSLRMLMEKSGVRADAVCGIGLTGQMHGLVLLNGAGEVLRNAIIWCDQRSGQQCERLTREIGRENLIAHTANPALTGFTASKLLWVKEKEPKLFEQCRHILLPKDYIRYRLADVFATDVSDASGMQLLDVKNRCWSREMLAYFGLDESMLCRVYESPEKTGAVSQQAAAQTGLAAGTPVVAGAGDNAAAAVGTGVISQGRAFTTIGTSGVVFAHTDAPHVDPEGRIHTFCCAVPGAWHVMGVTQAAGLSLKWLRDELCEPLYEQAQREKKTIYRLMDELASRIQPGANRLLFLPYLMGERTPHLDPECRGVFFGLSAIHTRADLIRAVMEGVSYSLLDCLSILRGLGIPTGVMTLCGGGANSFVWKQMLADVFACPVDTMREGGGAAQGAAILAAVGGGLFPDLRHACAAFLTRDAELLPDRSRTAQYEKAYALYRKLYPALKPLYKELSHI